MKKIFIFVFLFLLISINVLAEDNNQEINETELTVAHLAYEGQYHPFNEGFKKMQQVLDKETGGQIKLKIYAGGSLTGNEIEMLNMIKSGLLDIAVVSTSLTTYEPMISILGLPYIFRNLDHVEEVLEGEVGRILNDRLEEKGFSILTWWNGKGFRSVSNSVKPIYKPEDLKGMKIRVMEDPVYVDTFKAFGAIPVPISWGELHTALQTKTVDAHENDPQVINEYGFVEFSKYFSLTEHTAYPVAVVISTSKLNSLGEDGKKAMLTAADASRSAARKVADDIIEKSYEGIEAQGGFVNKVDNKEDFRKLTLPVIEKYKEKFGEEGAHLIDLILNS